MSPNQISPTSGGLIDTFLGWLAKLIERHIVEMGTLAMAYYAYRTLDHHFGQWPAAIIIAGLISGLLCIPWIRSGIYGFLSQKHWQGKLEKALVLQDSPLASRPPSVQKAERGRYSTKLTLRLKSGTTVTDLEHTAPALAVHYRLGKVRVDFNHRDASVVYLKMIKGSPLSDGVLTWPGNPGGFRSVWDRIPIGIDEDGEIVTVSLWELCFLIGGEPGSGKSVFLANLLAFLIQEPSVRLYIFDGKPPELLSWKALTEGFVDTNISRAIAMLDHLHALMSERQEILKDLGLKKVTTDLGLGVVAVVIDELPYYVSNSDTKAAKEFSGKLRDLMSRCRAAGIVVILTAQKPSTDTVPSFIRDVAPMRLAFRCSTRDASDTILGSGWATNGFSASSIPLADRGVGFLLSDSGTPVLFRSFWIDDDTQNEVIQKAVALRDQTSKEDR